jgi:hypothetical protein
MRRGRDSATGIRLRPREALTRGLRAAPSPASGRGDKRHGLWRAFDARRNLHRAFEVYTLSRVRERVAR